MLEKVGIGQHRVLHRVGVLAAHGLGSCIGLFLYDSSVKVGGLAHIMLPGRKPEEVPVDSSRYAENAFENLTDQMARLGASPGRIGAILIGGAHMFRDAYEDVRQTIGQKNQDAVLDMLRRRLVPIVAHDLGGEIGRTMEADVSTGTVIVRTFRSGTKEFLWDL
ncbi:MAG TPA: chemotaxis protein CheD [Acidobacteriota bacterium]|nr:chemotaxis protein CheD [Acidobacteriota bacterium]